MRAVVQRVKAASVKVDGELVSEIGAGVLIFLGVTHDDTPTELEYIANKVANLRIFEDAEGKMNCSLSRSGRGSTRCLAVHPLRRLPQRATTEFYQSRAPRNRKRAL